MENKEKRQLLQNLIDADTLSVTATKKLWRTLAI